MNLNELQPTIVTPPATAIATVVRATPIMFRTHGPALFGEWNKIPWDDIGFLGGELAILAANVFGQPASAFSQTHMFDFGRTEQCAECGVQIGSLNGDAAWPARFGEPLAAYLAGIIVPSDPHSADLFPVALAPEIRAVVDKQIVATLQERGGRRILMPMKARVSGNELSLSGRFADPPPGEVNRTPFELIGRIEGYARPDRRCKLLIRQGSGHFEMVNFDLQRHLAMLRQSCCDDQVYRFTVHREPTARAKTITVLDKVEPLPRGLDSL
jgi:hypothetical protein